MEIRFYGHYFEVFDASVLQFLPDVQCILLDCLTKAVNLEALSNLHSLAELALGVFELENPDILSYCNLPTLKVLSVGTTRKCNIDFRHLAKCVDLEQFHTTGQTKNISTICNLPLLSDLTLSSMTKKDDIEFVCQIPALKKLRFMLGGRTSIAQVTAPLLETLKVIRVQGLEDLGDIGRFENLARLLIEDQIRVAGIKVGPNPRLADMTVFNCKTLEKFSGVEGLQGLSSLRIYKTAIDYESFVTGPMPGKLKIFEFHTGKIKRDAEIRADLEKRGFHERARQ